MVTQEFETPRLICRPFTMADCGDMLRNWIAENFLAIQTVCFRRSP
ncbi:MAG: hypothetical protein J6A57_02150 [Ruminococcus sp.]|nr:hypothetical protein [Ruminococcus sp.]